MRKVTITTARELLKGKSFQELMKIEKKSGVTYHAMRGWKCDKKPNLNNFLAVMETLGYDVVLVEKSE